MFFLLSVIKKPSVKKMLNVPIIVSPPPSPTSGSKPAFSFFEAMKRYAKAEAEKRHKAGQKNPPVTNQSISPLSLPIEKPTVEDQKSANQKESRAAVLSQRIKRLEKEVKGRKKKQRR